MILQILILLFLIFNSIVFSETLAVAGVEHSPITGISNASRYDAYMIMSQNLLMYEFYIEQFTSKIEPNVHKFMLFPEDGLYGSDFNSKFEIFNYLEEIPSVGTQISCDHQSETILAQISCLVQQYNISLSVNLGELVPLEEMEIDKHNPKSFSSYNTNLIISNNGTILSKYHKINLYYEDAFDPGSNDQNPNFSLAGRKWSILTCFDVFFPYPRINFDFNSDSTDLTTNNNLEDINHIVLFPSWWVNDFPFISAQEIQHAWSRVHPNVLFVASGIGSSRYASGSGIYLSGDALIQHFNPFHPQDGDGEISAVFWYTLGNRISLSQKSTKIGHLVFQSQNIPGFVDSYILVDPLEVDSNVLNGIRIESLDSPKIFKGVGEEAHGEDEDFDESETHSELETQAKMELEAETEQSKDSSLCNTLNETKTTPFDDQTFESGPYPKPVQWKKSLVVVFPGSEYKLKVRFDNDVICHLSIKVRDSDYGESKNKPNLKRQNMGIPFFFGAWSGWYRGHLPSISCGFMACAPKIKGLDGYSGCGNYVTHSDLIFESISVKATIPKSKLVDFNVSHLYPFPIVGSTFGQPIDSPFIQTNHKGRTILPILPDRKKLSKEHTPSSFQGDYSSIYSLPKQTKKSTFRYGQLADVDNQLQYLFSVKNIQEPTLAAGLIMIPWALNNVSQSDDVSRFAI